MSTAWPGYQHGPGQIRDTNNDYRKFVPKLSNGLVENGTELLNASIEAYLYSILGVQARTRQSIVSHRASSLETQNVFRKLLEDSIINYDTTTCMNTAVSDTNVVLNTAISPTLWLIPSLIILKNPVEGYNNKLKVSTQDMKFGINKGLNFEKSPVKKLEKKQKKTPSSSSSYEKENIIILSLSLVAGILFSKYILQNK